MFINLLLNHQEIHCVEERYVRNCKNHAWADKAIRKEYPKQFAIEDLSPDHQEGEKTENESAWSNFSAETTYKSYKSIRMLNIRGGDRSADVEYSPCLPSISLIRIVMAFGNFHWLLYHYLIIAAAFKHGGSANFILARDQRVRTTSLS